MLNGKELGVFKSECCIPPELPARGMEVFESVALNGRVNNFGPSTPAVLEVFMEII